jgi:hypothetical protein
MEDVCGGGQAIIEIRSGLLIERREEEEDSE